MIRRPLVFFWVASMASGGEQDAGGFILIFEPLRRSAHPAAPGGFGGEGGQGRVQYALPERPRAQYG